jgi:hypothetical protein
MGWLISLNLLACRPRRIIKEYIIGLYLKLSTGIECARRVQFGGGLPILCRKFRSSIESLEGKFLGGPVGVRKTTLASVAIFGVAAIVLSFWPRSILQSKRGITEFQIKAVIYALSLYQKDTGRYPASLDLLVDSSVGGKYFSDEHALLDAWGNKFVYSLKKSAAGDEVIVYSMGVNGLDDGARGDDIVLK